MIMTYHMDLAELVAAPFLVELTQDQLDLAVSVMQLLNL